MKVRSWAAVLVVVLEGCAAVYGERPAGTGRDPGRSDRGDRQPTADHPAPPEDGASTGADDAATVVGTIGPEGALVADTLQGVAADTSRVERETVVTGTVRRAGETGEGRETAAAPPRTDRAPLVDGWRVQVFADRDPAASAEVASRLEERVPGEDVHIEAGDGWHKVRVGDFVNREDAERLRSALTGLGFPEAWVVRTAVRADR